MANMDTLKCGSAFRLNNVQSQPILVDHTVNHTSGRRNAVYQLNLISSLPLSG